MLDRASDPQPLVAQAGLNARFDQVLELMAGDGKKRPGAAVSLGADGFDATQGIGTIEVFVVHASQSVTDELFGDVGHGCAAAL